MSINLSTNYGGLSLKNPIIVGSSNIVTDTANLIKLQEAGAAAIVYKSLFEEQIELESFSIEQKMEAYQGWDAEHDSFFPPVKHAGPAEHLLNLKEARNTIDIPLIGSLNCVHDDMWVQFAQEMESTGIDALELNFYAHENDFDTESATIESKQIETLKKVRKAIKIPVFVKLSPFYSSTLRLISQMDAAGSNGFVLFNRLFQPDIDVDKIEHFYPYNFSSENDNRLAIRYAGLLHKKIHGSIVANTGILSGKDVVKMLLAGADAVQVVSCIYKRGIHQITTMLEELERWMKKNNYSSLESFRGILSKENLSDPFAYKRAQYVDILMKADVFMQYHPKRGELPPRHHEEI
ncbi:MAG: dihydroorotate dehydrogenase-like protein [Cyclobacteriaceae bacterium]|nr:dihydroorotate dehydrogenase-like protein [Cyclobacteriaceae bacterium]MDH4298028.1 dihydroorotate dehydrogenase-like protein [Cyclobacteriaceae bacterium]MDH5248531.1 dihydroorotate dehydrogenase-like protein [Cyclobacteriaceae bacterium]